MTYELAEEMRVIQSGPHRMLGLAASLPGLFENNLRHSGVNGSAGDI
jgi:hypothetical protein